MKPTLRKYLLQALFVQIILAIEPFRNSTELSKMIKSDINKVFVRICPQAPTGKTCFAEFTRDFNFSNTKYNSENFMFLGGGYFGKVYLDKKSKTAVKVLRVEEDETEIESFLEEVNTDFIVTDIDSKFLSKTTQCCSDKSSGTLKF